MQKGRIKLKATGIVRKVDPLGRIVIPKGLRRDLRIKIEDPMEIMVDDDYIYLRKYTPTCIICRGRDDIIEFRGKCICRNCLAKPNER